MNRTHQSIFKKTVLFFTWLFCPPLFLVFSIIWKSPKLVGRIILTIIAPLTITTFIIIFIYIHEYHYYYFKRGNRLEIEVKTGLKFPDYKAIEKKHFTDRIGFKGDFMMQYSVKLDTANIQEFYNQIEAKIQISEKQKEEELFTHWNKHQDENYYFSHIDFNDEDDQILSITIDKKSSIAEIEYGRM